MGILENGASDLISPFGDLGIELSAADLRETAYEIFVAACRPSGGKPLTYITQSERTGDRGRSLSSSPLSFSSASSSVSSLQRTLTSTAASKVKKTFGLKSSNRSSLTDGSPVKSSKKTMTVAELMRVQMRISEQKDARIRRALLRIAAGQLGKRIESIVLPLEFLQQFKVSDFLDAEEYEAWKLRNLKVLEAGMVLHPVSPLEENDRAMVTLHHVLKDASVRPLETGKNSESMQVLRSAVMALACRSLDGYPLDLCHWADGLPLNLLLYQKLLEACFDGSDESALIEELDEVLELLKKTWMILGLNEMLHNLCFSWVLFHRFLTTGQVENDLLFAAENQLGEVGKGAKATKGSPYAKILNSTLSSMLSWAEKRLLAYHDTFQAQTFDSLQSIASLGISAAKILVEDISSEYRRKRGQEVDVARNSVETYIRSSLRTVFAQKMEKVVSNKRSSKNNQDHAPVLAVLAKDIGDLAKYEKEVFTPILKKWHPLASGVAVATLHACYGRELKQFVSCVAELTPDAVQVLKAADKLEKELVNIAVEDAVDSEDGGKGIIREMPPYEAESALANLARTWIKLRVDRLREWIDRTLQQEVWNPVTHKEKYAPSVVEVLRMLDETIEAFFQLPIPMHQNLLPDLVSGLDRDLQHYISKAKSRCGTRSSFIPTLPPLTRCRSGSKFCFFQKKEKFPVPQKKQLNAAGTENADDAFSLPKLCIRMNTLHQIRTELEILEGRMMSHLRNTMSDSTFILSGKEVKFDIFLASCHEGIQQLCEATAYKVVFNYLNHTLWEGLYIGEPTSSRIEPVLRELEPNLELIASTVHNKVHARVLTALMKASFDGFLLVLLAGGPNRAFSLHDFPLVEEDFGSFKQFYLAGGDGLPQELVQKAATTVTAILPLFRTETDVLIERFKCAISEHYGPSKSKLTLPPTPDDWMPSEPNTILRVLCHRNDEAATKFLKKTYGLPKKL